MSLRTLYFQTSRLLLNYKLLYSNEKIVTNSHNLTFAVLKNYCDKPLKCWQCGIEKKHINELFCEKCTYIQEPHEKSNYFKVFDLNEEFVIDPKQLTQKYRQMQSLLHPDKFTNKSDEEKNISEEFSSLVNKAYHILQVPLKRAIHLLQLKGGKIEESQRIDNPEFLMEIMELNEEVETASTDEELKRLKQKNDKELIKIASELQEHFSRNEIQKAKESIIKMKYYNSVSQHINNLMREKGIVD